jgi:hypothetical protein
MAVEILKRIYDAGQSKAEMLLCKPIKHILSVYCLGDKEIVKILICPDDDDIELSKLN